jgi:hypothetical protein
MCHHPASRGTPKLRPSVAVTAQENPIFSDLHARAVDEESPSLSAGPIVEAIPISDSEPPQSLHPRNNKLLKSRKCRIISALTLAVVIGALVAVVLLTQKSSNVARGSKTQAPPTSGNETAASSTFLAELKPLLSNESLIALDEPASPQALSLRWLLERSNFQNWPFRRQVQRYAMATIYYATDGKSWSNGGGNWLTNETECRWFQGSEGDFCGENGTELQYLNQSNNTLNGKLPNDIGLLSSLTIIDLSMNQIFGPPPLGLRSMTALTSLALNDQQIKRDGTVGTWFLDCIDLFDA